MKKIILMLLLCISFGYAKEVDLNTTDFLGIKYNSSKKEVQKALLNMDYEIESITENEIKILNCNFELFSKKIDKLSLMFRDNKFQGLHIEFNNIQIVEAFSFYHKIFELYPKVYYSSIKPLSDDTVLLSLENTEILEYFIFCNADNFYVEKFLIFFGLQAK